MQVFITGNPVLDVICTAQGLGILGAVMLLMWLTRKVRVLYPRNYVQLVHPCSVVNYSMQLRTTMLLWRVPLPGCVEGDLDCGWLYVCGAGHVHSRPHRVAVVGQHCCRPDKPPTVPGLVDGVA